MKEEIVNKTDYILMKLAIYVKEQCFRKDETQTACSKRLGVSSPSISKIMNNLRGVSLNQMVKILRNDGKLNEESVSYIFELFFLEFFSYPNLSLQVEKCNEQNIVDLKYFSMGHLIDEVHKMSNKVQDDISVGANVSCSFIQKAIKQEGNQSFEKLNKLFGYYMQIVQPDLRAELIYNFFNLLCAKTFSGDGCFHVMVKGG